MEKVHPIIIPWLCIVLLLCYTHPTQTLVMQHRNICNITNEDDLFSVFNAQYCLNVDKVYIENSKFYKFVNIFQYFDSASTITVVNCKTEMAIDQYTFIHLSRNLHHLKIHEMILPQLWSQNFITGTYLRSLDLRNNQISEVNETAFYKLSELDELYLGENLIESIPSETFHPLTNAWKISLRHNRIRYLHERMFESNLELTEIDLSGNQFIDISYYLYAKVSSKLLVLHLANNKIANSIFPVLEHLTFLDLSHNNFGNLNFDNFKNLPSLQAIKLNDNGLTSISENYWVNNPRLNEIDLSNNPIRQFHGKVFHKLPKRAVLILNNISLTSISEAHFRDIVNLTDLHLEHNQIEAVGAVLQYNVKLAKLNLANNLMTVITQENFSNLTGLRELHLSQNRISKIDSNSFQTLHQLEFLNLRANYLHEIPLSLLASNLMLVSLDLSDNRLTSVTENFAKLTKLEHLNLRNNLIANINSFESNKHLQTINLSYNRMKKLTADNILSGGSLISLNVSHNLLADVHISRSELFDKLKVMDLSHNRLTDLSNISFYEFQNLTELYLQHNAISVPPKTPLAMRKLKVMDLSYNRFVESDQDFFFCNPLVSHLNLEHNRLTLINRHKISLLRQLQILHLNHNHFLSAVGLQLLEYSPINAHLKFFDLSENILVELPVGMFTGSESLKFLNLSDCELIRILNGTFDNLNRMEILDLHRNRIRVLPVSLFSAMRKLRALYLHSNLIEHIDKIQFTFMGKLELLTLNDNSLVRISSVVFQTLSNLKWLFLHDNRIQDFELSEGQTSIFGNNFQLTELTFSRNLMKEYVIGRSLSCRSARVLDLAHNHIRNLTVIEFREESELSSLRLNDNLIQSINTTDFCNLQHLQRLYLQNNEISVIVNGTFYHNTRLEYLDLSNNSIQTWIPNLFASLNKLRYLNLSGNEVAPRIPFNLPSNLSELYIVGSQMTNMRIIKWYRLINLTVISLPFNNIEYVPQDVFHCNRKLLRLNLSHNNITQLDQKCFETLTELQEIDLSFNELYTLDTQLFRFNHKLRSIDLSNVRLEQIDDSLFAPLTRLEALRISYNPIKLISENFLRHNNNLTIVEVSGCQATATLLISKLLFGNKLVAQTNDIEVIPVFNKNANWSSIDFSHNSIAKLEAQNFQSLSNLTELQLSSNNINQISATAFALLMKLLVLDLSNNQIVSLPKSVFSPLKSLKFISLFNNRLIHLSADQFQGNPGLISIELSSNNITHFFNYTRIISSNAFCNSLLTEVQVLSISNNKLTSIGRNFFQTTPQLRMIDLSRNEIIELQINFTDVPNFIVSHINLSHNNLSSIPRTLFGRLYKLKYLDLSHNQLTSFSYFLEGMLKFQQAILIGLNELQLNDNHLENFNVNVESYSYISTLNLSQNRLKKLQIYRVSVTHLNIDNNFITGLRVHPDTIDITGRNNGVVKLLCSDNLHIQKLNLENSNFSINVSCFEQMHRLEVLQLSNSNLKQNHLRLLSSLTKLNYFNISRNEFREIDFYVFQNLTNLRVLDVAYNNITGMSFKEFKKIRHVNNLTVLYNDGNGISNSIAYVYLKTVFPKLQEVGFEYDQYFCKYLEMIFLKFEEQEVTVRNYKDRNLSIELDRINEILCVNYREYIYAHNLIIASVLAFIFFLLSLVSWCNQRWQPKDMLNTNYYK